MTSNTTYQTTVRTRPSDPSGTSDLPDLGTVLGVWAHPDDEAYLSSGLVLHARAAGRRVVVVTATDGELGGSARTAPGRRRLAATRRRELAASLQVLGVDEHHRLGYADGGCASVDRAAAVERVAAVIEDVRPDTIVTFGPDGMTGHRDHRTVGSWTVEAAALAGHRGRVWFPTLTPQWHRRWSALNDRVGLWMDAACVPVTPQDRVIRDGAPDRRPPRAQDGRPRAAGVADGIAGRPRRRRDLRAVVVHRVVPRGDCGRDGAEAQPLEQAGHDHG